MTKYHSVLMVAGICLLPLHGFAASPLNPGAIQERSTDTLKFYEMQKRIKDDERKKADKKDSIVDETSKTKVPDKKSDAVIFVREVRTNVSEILSAEEIKSITTAIEGKQVTINDLFETVGKINTLYKEKGFIAAKAVLPPQKVKEGIIKIKLIEAHVGAINIKNNKHTKSVYIKDRVAIKEGDLVSIKELEEEIFYFNTNQVTFFYCYTIFYVY